MNKAPKCQGYSYLETTGRTNLRNHLHNYHGPIYDMEVMKNNWPFKLSTHKKDASTCKSDDVIRLGLPSFSAESFLEYLVRFIVADDQVHLINLSVFTCSQVVRRFV